MKSNINLPSSLKKIRNLFIIYLLLISTFLVTMFASYAIPNERIRWHVNDSIPQLQAEGLYPKLFFNSPACRLDNYTDAYMLNIALNADNNKPIISSLNNSYKSFTGDKIKDLEMSMYNKGEEVNYSRYWHGYQTILRPLLVFLDYSEIRFINMFALFLLFVTVICLLKKQLGYRVTLCFFTAMMMSMFFIVPMSLQFSSMFYVMFIAMIVVLLFHNKIYKNNLSIYIFFIIGCVANFLDFLTAPLITLGLPLITYILLINKYKNTQFIENFIQIMKSSILWSVGYAFTWISKWIIGSMILKRNVLMEAAERVAIRASNSGEYEKVTAIDVINRNVDLVYNHFTFLIFIGFLILFIIGIIFFRDDLESIISRLPILLVGIMPFIWFTLTMNHSDIHFWFTYRILSLTVFSVLAFMLSCIDTDKVKKLLM